MYEPVITLAPPSQDGGFCLTIQGQKLSDGLYPNLGETSYKNPGSDWSTPTPIWSMTWGTLGEGKGMLCYSPNWTFQQFVDSGIQSGAELRIRNVNQPLPQYGEPDFGTKPEIYNNWKDEDGRWSDWSNVVTITFAGATSPGKGKGRNKNK